MVFTTVGQSGVQVAIGVNGPTRPQYLAIGSGSGADAISVIALVHEVDRNAPTSINTSTTNKIIYTTDFNSVEMSGIDLREIGMFTESAASTGSCWDKEGFGAVTFDGTNELQVQLTYNIY